MAEIANCNNSNYLWQTVSTKNIKITITEAGTNVGARLKNVVYVQYIYIITTELTFYQYVGVPLTAKMICFTSGFYNFAQYKYLIRI